jgi:hypothetical protein
MAGGGRITGEGRGYWSGLLAGVTASELALRLDLAWGCWGLLGCWGLGLNRSLGWYGDEIVAQR